MERSAFLKTLGIMGLGISGLKDFMALAGNQQQEDYKHPVLFLGHGSPMNVLADNAFTQRLNKLGKELVKPSAILMVSAHWLTKGTFVATTDKPETIYDFYGFPKEMYQIKYASPGSPEKAKETKEIIKGIEIKEDPQWGLDHGAWTILKHLYPAADIPVFQLSLDYKSSTQQHYDLAVFLEGLRSKGVLIIGSGNITHNLGNFSMDPKAKIFDWAQEFDEKVKKNISEGNHGELINYTQWGKIAQLAHPSNDHYLPLLYTLGASRKTEKVEYIYEAFEHGSLSMRCIKIG